MPRVWLIGAVERGNTTWYYGLARSDSSSRDYHVVVVFKGQAVVGWSCECPAHALKPYRMCKHVRRLVVKAFSYMGVRGMAG